MHGYGEFTGYASMGALIRHTVRKGSVVIYPRWQTAIATPCPGPLDIEPCIDLGDQRHPRRPRLPSLGPEPSAASDPSDQLLRLLLRRHRHGEPRQPVPEPAPAEAAGDLPRRPARRRARRVRRARTRRLPVGHPVDREARVPRPAPRACSPSRARADWPGAATRSFRCWDRSRRGTRTSCSPTPTTTATDALAPCTVCAPQAHRLPGFGKPNAYDWNFCWKVWDAPPQLRLPRDRLPLRARQHAPASLQWQVERRRAGHAAEDPGRRTDPAARRLADPRTSSLRRVRRFESPRRLSDSDMPGNRRSIHAGVHQARAPSSRRTTGWSSRRTSVASSSTADGEDEAHLLGRDRPGEREGHEDHDHDAAAALITGPVRARPSTTASRASPLRS